MPSYAEKLFLQWQLSDADDSDGGITLEDAIDQIKLLDEKLLGDYEPTPYGGFGSRLDKWLQNTNAEEQQKLLTRVLSRIFYIGHKEFESLYRAAASGVITRWLVDQEKINILDIDAAKQLETAADKTWFCPLTDSMRINAFVKATGWGAHSVRPEWRSLREFGDPTKIRNYINTQKIKRLVLLEDFVGSADQGKKTLEFAASIDPNLQVLFCPLSICPTGDEAALCLVKKYSNFQYGSPLILSPENFIPDTPPDTGDSEFNNKIRTLVINLNPKTTYPKENGHGFMGMGALIALYSNCPDNTILFFWSDKPGWNPIFPRVTRKP